MGPWGHSIVTMPAIMDISCSVHLRDSCLNPDKPQYIGMFIQAWIVIVLLP